VHADPRLLIAQELRQALVIQAANPTKEIELVGRQANAQLGEMENGAIGASGTGNVLSGKPIVRR
jgi:hypothetical protein